MRKNLIEVKKMLKSFEINNFNSIKEPIVFSMEADTELTEHEHHIRGFDTKNKILKVASIYGPNASGKSTLLMAIHFVKDIIQGRLSREGSAQIENRTLPFSPFEFNEKKDNRTTVSIVFVREKIEFWYRVTVSLVEDENTLVKIDDEFFGVRHEHSSDFVDIFSREHNDIRAKSILDHIGVSKLPVSNDMTVLRHLYVNYSHIDDDQSYPAVESDDLGYVADLYEEILSMSFLTNLTLRSFRPYHRWGRKIEENKEYIVKSLQDLDIQISDFLVENKGERYEQIYCLHTVDNHTYQLRLEQESQGTILLIYLLLVIAARKTKPTIFLVDELDSHLHPKLVREIVRLFNSDLNRHHQLIFNSHDMWNMVPEQFRRDQIWFTYRNEKLATELLCLSDVVNYKGERIRKDAKYAKQYMEGKYGADPFINKGLNWNVE